MTQREVLLEGGLPWGFRMHGGFDTKTPLKISRVNPGSKAAVRGVREGDFITTINGQSTKNLTNNEAHNLLKASGNTLKLGLNEDSEGSPKRRYIKTIRQESHQETIRKSSVTYSLQETFETLSNKQRNDINKRGINANDGDAIVVTNIPVSQSSTSSSSSTSTPNTLVAEGKTVSTDQAEVSRQSSYSNCSSIPDEGRKNGDETEAEDMNDGQERVSKSKRRRQRRKNLLQRQTSQENRTIVEIKEVTADINAIPEEVEEQQPPKSPEQEISTTNLEIIKLKRVEHKYKVESPKELRIEQIKRADKKLKVKSRSLDDDDLLNIQELSEASEAEDSKHPPDNVVISEASSEENLLNDADTQRAKRSTLSDITLKLNENNVIESVSHISPEEEKQLRSFLGSLKLVDSPEESAKDLYERAESDSNTNTKKKQTRKELEQYFLPMAHNPRFLDAISEEASDMSDRESHSSKIDKNPKQGTPEQELKPPPVPPRKNKSKLLQKYAGLPDKNDVFLVETKTVDPIGIQEDVCNTKTLKENAEKAEVVYINESSDSSISSSENTKENDDKDILQVRTNESLTTTISSHVTSTKNKSKSNEFSTDLDAALLTELTPPPSPENNSHNGNTTEGSILKHILFDYTKVPNVLTEKEPDTGFKGLKRSTVETCKTETTKTESKSFNNQKEIKSLTSIHTNKETVNGEIKNIDVLKVSIDEKNDDGNIETRKSIEEYSGNPKNTDAATEKLDENVLKHMMMVSKDSNKTDNEKLLEFETICKINSELKQKIKKQESFGAMRSQSIDEKFTHKTSDNNQKEEEEEEYVPTKNLVQRRVKEFSGQVFNEQTVSAVSESENVDSNDLVKARVAKFLELDEKSNKVDLNHKTSKANNSLDNAKTNSNRDGSILKKILLPESREIDQLNPPDTNPTCIKNGLTESTIKLSEIIENEINTAIKVEESDSKELQGTSNVENNVPITSSDSDSKPFIGTERYIPITTEESDKTDVHSKTENLTNINKSADNISVHKIENIESTTRSTSVKNASTPNTDLKMRNFGSISGHLKEMSKSVDNVMTNQKFEGLKSPIERTIPIKIEDSNAMKEFRNLSKSAENLSTHKTANNIERTIPITIEHLSSQIPRSPKLSEKYKSTENMSTSTSINQLKQFSKSVENISKSTTHREINIPIKVEGSTTCNKNKERIIPIIIENSKEPQDCASKSRDRLGTTTNSIESVSQTEKVNEIKVTTDKEINIPIKVENTDDTKKIIHTTIIENSNSKITQDSASKARQHLETTTKSIDSASQTEAVNEIKTTSDTERIIPITIEHANSIQENSITNKSTNSLVEESSSKFVDELKTINTSVENIAKDEMIGDIKYTIDREINIPDKVEESTNSTNNKEIIIPITIEKSNSNISVEDNTNSTITLSNENKMEASNSTLQNELKSITKSVENLAINQIVGETKAKENISFQHINVENTTNTKERIIPISVEDSNSKIDLSNSNSEKHKSADNTTDTSLPGRSNNKIETSNSKLLEKLKTISKSIENISKIHVVDEIKGTIAEEQNIPTKNKEKIIPISVEQCDAKVSVQSTNNTSNSTRLSSETPDREKKVTTPNTELLEQLKTITKSVENISKSQTTVNETKTAKCEETNAQIKLLNFIDSKERVIPISFGIADSESSNLYSQNTESKSDNIPVVSEDAKNDTISDNSSLLEKLKTIGKSMKNISKKDTSTEGVQNKDSNVKSSKVNEKIIPENSETIHTNVLSPPRRDSVSSDSSGESSRCTAKYNPNSSIGDITSITKEEENGGLKIVYEPMSLRSIVLNLMMSLPFGEEVLRELADVSKSIENYTNRLPNFFKSIHSQQEPKITQDNQVSAMPSTWYTDKDICVRQKGEGDRKCIEYDNRETTVMSPNRLLTIIREEPTETETSSEPSWSEDSSYRRLQARNLGEWLTLARNKSKSTSNLDCTNIPINTLRRNSNSSEPDRARLAKRRSSLPQELYERQLWFIMEKEREIQRELERLEDEKRKIQAEMAPSKQKQFHVQDFYVSKRGDYAEFREQEPKYRPVSMPVFPTEYFRQQMYNEYMDKFCEREERKQQKVIKISSSNDLEQNDSSPSIKPKEIVHPIELEKEFMAKVKAKKLGRSRDNVTSDSELEKDEKKEPDEKNDEPPVIVLDGDKVKGVDALPKHLQDFVDGLADYQDDSASNKIIISPCDKKCCKEARRIYRVLARNRAKKQYSLLHEIDASLTIAKGFLFGKGIWSPGQHPPTPISKRTDTQQHQQQQRDDPISPVWTPKSANSSPIVERKEFRPVNFQSPVLTRRNRTQSESLVASDKVTSEPPWKIPEGSSDTAINLSSTLDRRLPNSQSSPGIGIYSTTPRLPRAQNPTITLLQKAREGHLPRGAQYIDQERKPPNDRPPIKYPGEVLYHIKNEYTSESDSEKPRKMADLAPRKFEGIGPTTKDGMPLILRSEVKDKDQSKWYKRMYDTIHKQKPHKDEFVTIKYRQKRAQYPYTSGYLSEPEPGAYDSDFTEYKYATLDRRRPPEAHHHQSSATMPRSHPDKSYSSSDIVRNTQETYRVQPGRIENYVPGHSSISESEAKKWWDEVMGIFDGHLEQQNRVPPHKPRSFINQALKESGYESDSTLIFKRKEDNANRLNPREQREAYKVIQKGGDVPFQGLRKPAPERPKETDLVEFYPLSPTLTKIRIHKSVIPPQECYVPQKEFLCYPVTIQHDVPKTFANFKRTVPSMATSAAASVPSPPKRRSSRNNTTLRLISTMKVQKSPTGKRHETCFTTGPSVERTKVNYLKDKITCKLSPVNKKKGDAAKMSVVKKVTASPELKSKITSTLTTSKDPKSSVRRVQSSTKISTEKTRTGTFGGIYKSGSTGSITSKKSSTENLHSRTPTPVKTFGVEKKKFDLKLTKVPDVKASSSQGLLSPTEVKKGMRNISNPNAQYRKSLALLSSSKINNTNAALPIKVGITEKGKNLLKSSVKRPQSVSPKSTRKITPSPCPSTSSERSKIKSSTESLSSSKSSKKIDKNASKLKNKPEKKTTTKPSCKKSAELSKCLSKATGADIAKKLDRDGASEIVKQKEAIESNHFFRNLLLRGVKQSASFTIPKNSWIVERTNQLQRRRSVSSEPSIGAMKIYLKHTKPVTDSKFVSLDVPRSRSASPKSVTFCEPPSRSSTSKRSKSLPTKIVFTETSRPVSPVIPKKKILPILKSSSKDDINVMARGPSPQAKVVLTETSRPITPPVTRRRRSPISISKSTSEYYKRTPSPQTKLYFSETSRPVSPEISRKTPTHSPVLPRAPSCRKIMQLKQMAEPSRPEELSLYSCADLKHSTTSLDSFRSDDYQIYLKDIGFHSPKSEKFKDLNHFYSDIEKVGQLEQKCSLKPRKKAEEEIIDYDRWMEVRSRERAEHELKCLYNHLRSHEREKGFLFLPKDIERFRWKRELDRGLRIKEKSVENIKEEFDRIKKDESDLENARRREIAYSKDTYKPLWRGNSVINLASILSERRSQSESRVKSSKNKLLDDERGPSHGIGSRIWSSLSMEQVNNLKRQLQDIYGDESTEKTDSKLKDYTVDVPKDFDKKYIPSLTIRRNSESSKPDAMNEDEKKMISQLLSKEALEKIVKRRKEDKLALPVMVGKEVLGAIATQEAIAKKPLKMEEPPKPLVKTNALSIGKQSSISEAESASTDESTRTVINLMDVQKKVEYFEKAKDLDTYVPTVYQPAEDGSSQSEGSSSPTHHLGSEITSSEKQEQVKHTPSHSKSYQDLKEYFGESELVKFATLPLSATKKSSCTYTKKPQLRALDISPIRTISEANSLDSLCRSRSVSPYYDEMKSLTKKGEVKKLKKQFELFEDFFGEKKLQRSRSENDLRTYGHVEDLKRKYEYPVHSGRGRSRTKRGGVVSPVWLRPEDRYMPHINIISKIASLYSFSKQKSHKDASRSMEELAEILGCPIGEVEKMKEKFDKMCAQDQISLMGHMYTSSPNLKELRDITPYLTANWIAHRYPRSEDNTRSLSSPDASVASRDTSLVRRGRSSSPIKQQSILKRAGDRKRDRERFESSVRYSTEPDIPPPPAMPQSLAGVQSQEQESPRKYVENEVTIHYKTPVRTEIKEYVSEDELAHRQAEAMKKIYEEEKRRKQIQELQDMRSRRHTDNFVPSQKSPIPLNRYDDFDDLTTAAKVQPRSPEPRIVAKALYNFVGHTARELTFRKGDLIYLRRQIDKNWYEGELNAMVGLFPVNYVEIVPYEGVKTTPRKAHEGQARAKYNFLAQTHLELSLAKGELVTITRKVDDNWFEGKIGGRKGIFPVSYVEVLIDPSDALPASTKPVASPAAHSLLLNGSSQGKESMGSHLYTPSLPNPIAEREIGFHHAKPIQLTGAGTYTTLPKSPKNPLDQALHIETQSEPIPYRALYKYTPQNDDELELLEGDTVYVLEKCDDGWYVGSSDRTGGFGTFPGNYVEKI